MWLITIRVWLGHVISITSEASTKEFCIDSRTSPLQNQKSKHGNFLSTKETKYKPIAYNMDL